MKEKIQTFGRFLSAMVMPNIGAFIAWGLLTALFIPTGWLPNEALSSMVGPTLKYLLPILIGYTGGKMVGKQRGAVIGAIATVGVVLSCDYIMLMGAMIMGPLAGWVIKKFDKAIDGKVKPGFEMLVDNFSLGIIGLLLMIVGFYVMGPFMEILLKGLSSGVANLVNHGLLPLISIFVEPAKVLFLNNAINHGIFTPLGAEQVEQFGKSIFYMIETNPGPGAGVLLAYWMFSKDKLTRDSAPGALIVHVLGGIHEIYFPYVLMNPILLLATIGGSLAAMLYNVAFNLGLSGPASPGSIIAYAAMAPKGSTFAVILSAVIGAGVSFAIAVPFVKMMDKKSLEDSKKKVSEMKAESKGLEKASVLDINEILFACDAGMGSSAMGASVLQKKFDDKGLKGIKVKHASVSEIPEDTKFVVCHKDLYERAKKSAPNAKFVLIENFMGAPEYDEIVEEFITTK